MANKTSRFSDPLLHEFHSEFRDHVTQYNEWIEREEKRIEHDNDRFNKLVEAQERNTEALELLIKETMGVVNIYKDWSAAGRVGSGIQKAGLWLIRWPLIALGLVAIGKWIHKIIN